MMVSGIVIMAAMTRGHAGRGDGWFRGFGGHRPPAEPNRELPQAREDPLTILRERYARGEIDLAEFERRLDQLVQTE
jgi:hypothetical protein